LASNFRCHDLTAADCARATRPSALAPEMAGTAELRTQLLRLRALLARARGDDVASRDVANRHCAMAESLGFEGHMARARSNGRGRVIAANQSGMVNDAVKQRRFVLVTLLLAFVQ
jgi:hypothetical protein